jgi:ABC-type glutathione transport system ATPase component
MLNVDITSVSVLTEIEKKILLQNIKFDLEKSKIYTILGKNGSGKSTLIKSLTALLPAYQYEVKGKVIFSAIGGSASGGNAINLINAAEGQLREIRKNNIRYVFQDVANSLDPLKKMKYYFDISEANSELIEEQLNFFLLPGYKKISSLYSYELSGGMAQRLLIVLALLANLDLIILDEPTSGVDYVVMNLILLKLKEFVKEPNKSVLIVTQDINFALKSSDYIAYLSNGKLSPFLKPDKFILSTSDNETKDFIKSFKEISNASA